MTQLSKIFYVAAIVARTLAYGDISGLPTYNAEPKAQDSDRLSLINHKACDNPIREVGCSTTSTSELAVPVPLNEVFGFHGAGYIDLYTHPEHIVNWTHANPQYSVHVMLQSIEREYNLTTNLPGNSTGLEFHFYEPSKSMNFSAAFSKGNLSEKQHMERFVDQRKFWQWVIGQPDDPRWKDSPETQNGLMLDKSTYFAQDVNYAYALNTVDVVNGLRENAADTLKAERHKWKLGVGIGVGLGVPAIAALAYMCGRHRGKKRALKDLKAGGKI